MASSFSGKTAITRIYSIKDVVEWNGKNRPAFTETKMDIKRWLKEDKGGFGAFLFVVILGLVFYALQREAPVDYELNQVKEVKATEMVVARDARMVEPPPDSGATIVSKPDTSERSLAALGSVKEPVKSQVKTAGVKLKPKTKPKYTRRPPSREEIVRSKLRAGLSVNQIAKATGYEKKYIRGIKKRKVCNCI